MHTASVPCASHVQPRRRRVTSRHSPRVCSHGGVSTLETAFDGAAASGEGVITFCEQSKHGSGLVSVLARGPWRSLVFQSGEAVTQQGLALLDKDGVAEPGALVFTYLRTCAAAVAALAPSPAQPRYLSLGLGAGSFPAFLKHHWPAALVQAVEIDPLVADACEKHLGASFSRLASTADLVSGSPDTGVQLLINDAAPCVAALAEAVAAGTAQPVDVILLDCFDQYGRVPPILDSPDFMSACSAALSPGGLLLLNAFNAEQGSDTRRRLGVRAGALAAAFGGAHRLFTFPVVGFEQNIIVVCQKAGGEARGGFGDMVARARRTSVSQGWAFDAGIAAAAALRLWPLPFARAWGWFWETAPAGWKPATSERAAPT
jgi:spermidine synthase